MFFGFLSILVEEQNKSLRLDPGPVARPRSSVDLIQSESVVGLEERTMGLYLKIF